MRNPILQTYIDDFLVFYELLNPTGVSKEMANQMREVSTKELPCIVTNLLNVRREYRERNDKEELGLFEGINAKLDNAHMRGLIITENLHVDEPHATFKSPATDDGDENSRTGRAFVTPSPPRFPLMEHDL